MNLFPFAYVFFILQPGNELNNSNRDDSDSSYSYIANGDDELAEGPSQSGPTKGNDVSVGIILLLINNFFTNLLYLFIKIYIYLFTFIFIVFLSKLIKYLFSY